jgi:protein-S-isoprenylcysteine O-methyltransferase Ste14
MEPDERDGAAVRFPPPLVYLLAVIAGGVLHLFVLPLPLPIGAPARIGGAIAAIALGLAMVAGAIGLFRRTGQDPKPWKSTPEVISAGVYKISRNPMYVGMSLLLAGIGIGWANGWLLALLPLILFVIYTIAIRHEEAYLERKFGDRYLAYKRSVRRWI